MTRLGIAGGIGATAAIRPLGDRWITNVAWVACLGVMAIVPGSVGAQVDSSFAAVQDTLSNPIRMACGEHVDPVGYVIYLGEELGLTAEQRAVLGELQAEVNARNQPLAQAWRTDRSMSSELRESYRLAVDQIEAILTPDQWAAALSPRRPDRESPGIVRCLFRSHLAIVRGAP